MAVPHTSTMYLSDTRVSSASSAENPGHNPKTFCVLHVAILAARSEPHCSLLVKVGLAKAGTHDEHTLQHSEPTMKILPNQALTTRAAAVDTTENTPRRGRLFLSPVDTGQCGINPFSDTTPPMLLLPRHVQPLAHGRACRDPWPCRLNSWCERHERALPPLGSTCDVCRSRHCDRKTLFLSKTLFWPSTLPPEPSSQPRDPLPRNSFPPQREWSSYTNSTAE